MILPDVNVLVYAYNQDARHHNILLEWWQATLTGRRPVGLAWSAMLGFLRVSTN